jgi:hypothetical protein
MPFDGFNPGFNPAILRQLLAWDVRPSLCYCRPARSRLALARSVGGGTGARCAVHYPGPT